MTAKTVGSALSGAAGILLDLLFPPRCAACGAYGSFLCSSCIDSLPLVEHPFCPVCAQPQRHDALCADCRTQRPAFAGARAPYRYEGAARKAVLALKYNHLAAVAEPMGKLLSDYLMDSPVRSSVDVIVPVPLHRTRQRQRGYNQAALLASRMGRACGLPVSEGVLARVRSTPPQVRASNLTQRRRNVADAFACHDDSLRGASVLVIDDVMTTGATLDACARALRAAGARSVWGLTFAREV